MEKKYSNESINRLGNRIRKERSDITEPTLNELQEYRVSHNQALSDVFKTLCEITKSYHSNDIVTFRIKRFESIIGKLSREPKMKFSRMWDIAGCRCILRSNKDVYRIKEEIGKVYNIRSGRDYILEPKESGYKALHLYVDVPEYKRVIEIQLRNKQDHNWATLVEITDLLFDSRLKEYQENRTLYRFHFLLSKFQSLDLKEKNEVARIINKYDYFETLSNVFSKNYVSVRLQWLSQESKSGQNYYLIETKKDKRPKIQSFSSFEDAEQKYFSEYKSQKNANIVLTYLPNPCYKQISLAYSNYILTYHSFLDECYDILESLISDALKTKKYITFSRIYNLYNKLAYVTVQNLNKEIRGIKITDSDNVPPVSSKRKKEWIKDIKSALAKMRNRTIRFREEFRRNYPNTYFGQLIVYMVIKKNQRKYNKIIDTNNREKNQAH